MTYNLKHESRTFMTVLMY